MRKTFKKIAAVAMATMMTLGCAMSAMAADEYKATIIYTDNNWGYGHWDPDTSAATTTVTGEGTYTMTLNAADVKGEDTDGANGALVFCVDVIGAAEALAGMELKDLTIKLDGTAIAVDMTKLVTGDIEEKGNYRIEIRNEYGSTKDAAGIDASAEGFTFSETLEVSFTIDDPATSDDTSNDTTNDTTTNDTTTNDTTTNDTTTNDTTTDNTANNNTTTTPNTGDSSMVAMYLVVALAAAAVVLKKRTATN